MRKRGLIRRAICPLHYAGSSRLVVIGEKLPIMGQLLDSHPFLDWWRWRFRSRRKREKQCMHDILALLLSVPQSPEAREAMQECHAWLVRKFVSLVVRCRCSFPPFFRRNNFSLFTIWLCSQIVNTCIV